MRCRGFFGLFRVDILMLDVFERWWYVGVVFLVVLFILFILILRKVVGVYIVMVYGLFSRLVFDIYYDEV